MKNNVPDVHVLDRAIPPGRCYWPSMETYPPTNGDRPKRSWTRNWAGAGQPSAWSQSPRAGPSPVPCCAGTMAVSPSAAKSMVRSRGRNKNCSKSYAKGERSKNPSAISAVLHLISVDSVAKADVCATQFDIVPSCIVMESADAQTEASQRSRSARTFQRADR